MQNARRLLSLLCAVALAGLVLAACGEDEDPAAADAQQSAGTGVEIIDFGFEPETVIVAAGDTVTWTNSETAPHTATDTEGAFDTGDLELGDEGTVTFEKPGTYAYYCRFHAFMKGKVEVQ